MVEARCPIHCILPPYMLEHLANCNDPKIRRRALLAIKQAQHLRAMRVIVAGQPKAAKPTIFSGKESHEAKLFRRVYDGGGTEALPGKLIRSEGQSPTGDAAVNAVYEGAGATFDLYWQEWRRNSIDDHGMPIDQTVHYGSSFPNAFWNGEQMVYGDGDGEIFDTFTSDLDIIGHELSHGVIQHEANLRYWFQSGALNEHYADVFGSLVKQRKLGQEAKDADWLIGVNVLKDKGSARYALRSMKEPGTAYVNHPLLGTDPQPGHMKDYKNLEPWDDNGGVHLNSGIPNHVFYLAAVKIGGRAWEKTGKIWYVALRDKLKEDASFTNAAEATVHVARELFGQGAQEVNDVTAAWKEVGL